MTLKTAVSSAAIRIYGNAPSAVFASQEQISIEMADLVNEVAVEIAESYEWQILTKMVDMVGAESFPVPADYDRMLVGQGIQDKSTWFWGYFPFANVSEYMRAIDGKLPLISPGGWIILDNEFKFYPAPYGTATFPYISKNIVRSQDGMPKSSFDRDDDTFILSERLLTLGLIWRYKAQKGLEYSEDLATYEAELAKTQYKDKGARVLRPDARYYTTNTRLAYFNRGVR